MAAGWGMLAAMILGTVLSTNYVRRKFFEVFYKFHWVMFLLVIGLAPLHYRCHIYIYPGVLIWFLDVLYRYFYLAMHRYPKDAIVFALPADVVRLEFPKGKFGYRPGQYVFICIPALAYFQWHPMSISSSPHQESVSIHIRALGDWTRKLYDMAKAGGAQGVKIHMLFEGPYGEPMIDLDNEKYKSVLLISGGIGITPMQSICNNLIYQEKNGRKLNKLWFVWSAADRYIIDAMWDGVKRLPVNDDPARLPLSFQPDDLVMGTTFASQLSRINNVNAINSDVEGGAARYDPLYTEFYLTRVRPDEAEQKLANIDPKLQSCLRFGRPKLEEIFKEMHQ
eukprot:gene19207-22961_t